MNADDKRVGVIFTTCRELELHRTPSAGSLSNVLAPPPNLPPPPPREAEMTEANTAAAAATVASSEAAAEGGIVELLEEPVEEMVSEAHIVMMANRNRARVISARV